MYQIADAKQHPFIEEAMTRIQFLSKKEKDLKKLVKERSKELSAEHAQIWEDIYDYVEKNKLVREGWNRKTAACNINHEYKTLSYIGEKGEQASGLEDIIRKLLR